MTGDPKRAADATGLKPYILPITFYGNGTLHKLSCHLPF